MTLRHFLQTAGALALAGGFLTSAQPAAAQEGYIGEIRMVGSTFCPRGWTEANGQLLPIAQYNALFSLYGTTYGGNGQTTFALPDLRGRQAIQFGQGPGLSSFPLGAKGGTETNTLTVQNMPAHNHQATSKLYGTTLTATATDPTGNVLGNTSRATYAAGTPSAEMQSGSVTTTVANNGGNQPVNNRDPYLAIRFCVVLEGVYPPRN